jgi:hypothetical protein
LHRAVRDALASGLIVATGYDPRSGIAATRVQVPADRWVNLNADFEKSEAIGSGLTITDIIVSDAEPPEVAIHQRTLSVSTKPAGREIKPLKRRGPKSEVTNATVEAMQADMRSGKETKDGLNGMKQDALAANYGVSRYTAVKALDIAVSTFVAQRNSDK